MSIKKNTISKLGEILKGIGLCDTGGKCVAFDVANKHSILPGVSASFFVSDNRMTVSLRSDGTRRGNKSLVRAKRMLRDEGRNFEETEFETRCEVKKFKVK